MALAVLIAAGSASASEDYPFDGAWTVILTCPDVHDESGLVKGYVFTFPVTISAGELKGERGAPGHPSSVSYTGHVSADGTLDIRALGNTGKADYAVGKPAQGARYGYTMQGRLGPASGQATRKEVRPCTATFTRS